MADVVVQTSSGRRLQPELRNADTLAAHRLALGSLILKIRKVCVQPASRGMWPEQWRSLYVRFAPILLSPANLPGALKYLRECYRHYCPDRDVEISRYAGAATSVQSAVLDERVPGATMTEFLDAMIMTPPS